MRRVAQETTVRRAPVLQRRAGGSLAPSDAAWLIGQERELGAVRAARNRAHSTLPRGQQKEASSSLPVAAWLLLTATYTVATTSDSVAKATPGDVNFLLKLDAALSD